MLTSATLLEVSNSSLKTLPMLSKAYVIHVHLFLGDIVCSFSKADKLCVAAALWGFAKYTVEPQVCGDSPSTSIDVVTVEMQMPHMMIINQDECMVWEGHTTYSWFSFP